MIHTIYDPELRVISTYYSGKIDAKEIIEYIDKLEVDKKVYENLLYFEDQSKAEFIFNPSEIRKLIHALFTKASSLSAIRVAILNLRPKETAFSLIAIRLLKGKKVNAKVFSTKEAALDWLLLKKPVKKILSD